MSENQKSETEATSEQKPQWNIIIRDMIILLAVMGTLGWLCKMAMKPFEVHSDTDALNSLILKGKITPDNSGTLQDEAFAKELYEDASKSDKDKKRTPEELANFVNSADHNKRTPLMWAAYSNFNDPTPVDGVKRIKDDKAEAPVLTKDVDRLFYLEKLLAIKGIDIQAKDKDGWTALHWAAWSGMPFVSLELIKAGLDPDQPEGNGYTPLQLAAMRGNDRVVQLLLGYGCKDTDGKAAALAAKQKDAYNKRNSKLYALIYSEARSESYAATVRLLTAPPEADREATVAAWDKLRTDALAAALKKRKDDAAKDEEPADEEDNALEAMKQATEALKTATEEMKKAAADMRAAAEALKQAPAEPQPAPAEPQPAPAEQ